MRRRRAARGDVEDRRPQLVSLEDKRRAERLLVAAYQAGELSREECSRRMGLVYQAVTPRDLWKASGRRAGSPRRSDRRELGRALRLQLGIVVFAVLIMMLLLYGTVLYQQGGVHDTHIWPWQWGKNESGQRLR